MDANPVVHQRILMPYQRLAKPELEENTRCSPVGVYSVCDGPIRKLWKSTEAWRPASRSQSLQLAIYTDIGRSQDGQGQRRRTEEQATRIAAIRAENKRPVYRT